jgi:drug/metabolite transporter (DMT)-like permease
MALGAVLSVLSAICFGLMAVMARAAYALGMDEWQMLLSRFVFGAVLLGAYIALRDPSAFRIRLSRLAAIAAVGLCIYTTQSLCFFLSLKYITASTTALIFYAHPAVVTLLAVCFLGLGLTRPLVLSVVSVSLGCALVFADAFARQASPEGLLFAAGATAVFSVYLLLCQVVTKGLRPLTASFYMILFTAIGFCLLHPPTTLLAFSGPQLAMGFGFGLIPTVMAILLLYAAIARVGSAYAAVFSSIEPVATLLFAAALLGEPLLAWQLFGTVFILAGIALPNLAAWRQAKALRSLS